MTDPGDARGSGSVVGSSRSHPDEATPRPGWRYRRSRQSGAGHCPGYRALFTEVDVLFLAAEHGDLTPRARRRLRPGLVPALPLPGPERSGSSTRSPPRSLHSRRRVSSAPARGSSSGQVITRIGRAPRRAYLRTAIIGQTPSRDWPAPALEARRQSRVAHLAEAAKGFPGSVCSRAPVRDALVESARAPPATQPGPRSGFWSRADLGARVPGVPRAAAARRLRNRAWTSDYFTRRWRQRLQLIRDSRACGCRRRDASSRQSGRRVPGVPSPSRRCCTLAGSLLRTSGAPRPSRRCRRHAVPPALRGLPTPERRCGLASEYGTPGRPPCRGAAR
jgi:hypothetical protein